MNNSLISAHWLHEHLSDDNLIILDASPKTNISGLKSDLDGLVIPSARYLDLKNDFSDPASPFPNTLPEPELFQKKAQTLGINHENHIVTYDNLGVYTSPRVWWMFRTMGHRNVSVLNGGLPEWVKMGFETLTTHATGFNHGSFTARLNKDALKSIDDITANLDQKNFNVIDARSAGRFNGTAPEPREGLSSGHMPNSCNLPFEEVLENGKYKPEEQLRNIFQKLNLDHAHITFSCGSGLTACIILLAAEQVLSNPTSVFDGSWTEWASTAGLPIKKNDL